MIQRIVGPGADGRPTGETVAQSVAQSVSRVAEELFDSLRIFSFQQQKAERRREPRRKSKPVLVLVSEVEGFSSLRWAGR